MVSLRGDEAVAEAEEHQSPEDPERGVGSGLELDARESLLHEGLRGLEGVGLDPQFGYLGGC